MNHKTIHIPADCIGAIQTALRVRIIYLQSYREKSEQAGYKMAADAMMRDIANLTMIADRIDETPFSK
jgi:hypothetical protein